MLGLKKDNDTNKRGYMRITPHKIYDFDEDTPISEKKKKILIGNFQINYDLNFLKRRSEMDSEVADTYNFKSNLLSTGRGMWPKSNRPGSNFKSVLNSYLGDSGRVKKSRRTMEETNQNLSLNLNTRESTNEKYYHQDYVDSQEADNYIYDDTESNRTTRKANHHHKKNIQTHFSNFSHRNKYKPDWARTKSASTRPRWIRVVHSSFEHSGQDMKDSERKVWLNKTSNRSETSYQINHRISIFQKKNPRITTGGSGRRSGSSGVGVDSGSKGGEYNQKVNLAKDKSIFKNRSDFNVNTLYNKLSRENEKSVKTIDLTHELINIEKKDPMKVIPDPCTENNLDLNPISKSNSKPKSKRNLQSLDFSNVKKFGKSFDGKRSHFAVKISEKIRKNKDLNIIQSISKDHSVSNESMAYTEKKINEENLKIHLNPSTRKSITEQEIQIKSSTDGISSEQNEPASTNRYPYIENQPDFEKTKDYWNFPVNLPSKLKYDPRFNGMRQTSEYYRFYSEQVETFINDLFINQDSIYQVMLRKGLVKTQYHAETNYEKIKKMAFQGSEEYETNFIHDTTEGGYFSYFDYMQRKKESESLPKPNKYVDKAEDAFKIIEPSLKNCEETIDTYGHDINFEIDLQGNQYRYKSILFKTELDKIKDFYDTQSSDNEDQTGGGDIIPDSKRLFGRIGNYAKIIEIDKLVKNLAFFQKLEKNERIEIIKRAKFRRFKDEDFVVQQGDSGNSMFIILYGSANVMINGIDPKTKLLRKYVVASIQDGGSFGEYSLLSFPTKNITYTDTIQKLSNLKVTLKPQGFKKILEVQKREKIIRKTEEQNVLGNTSRIKRDLDQKKREKTNYAEIVNSLKPKFIPNTRAASIQVVEGAYMLEISAEIFKKVIVEKIKEEMIEKIRLLSIQLYFVNYHNLNFIPIAMLMKKRYFKIGQPIILQGETPDSLFLIKSGVWDLVSVVTRTREANKVLMKSYMKKPIKNFNLELRTSFRKKQQEFKLSRSIINSNISIQEKAPKEKQKDVQLGTKDKILSKHNTRIFQFANIESNNDADNNDKNADSDETYLDFFFLKHMTVGETLWTRSVFSKNTGQNNGDTDGNSAGIPKAKLSIIANSAVVEWYELKKNSVIFIPEPTKSIMLGEIKKLIDHDINITKEELNAIEQWDNFKKNQFVEQLYNKQTTTKKDQYKKF